jgi:condensin complex subunit 2
MTSITRPHAAKQTNHRMSVNPFAAVLQDDDENTFGTNVTTAKPSFSNAVTLDNSSDKENDDNDDDDDDERSRKSSNRRVRPPRPSTAITATKRNAMDQRRRRRSSARFLQLSKVTTDVVDDDEDDGLTTGLTSLSQGNSNVELHEMYQTAIRLNAENKINTTNSWNLNIIDQMDSILSFNDDNSDNMPVDNTSNDAIDDGNGITSTTSAKSGIGGRVNFTKASCTLDASVKIYSYRVDDVHLTSYKVLANLNRTQSTKSSDKTTNQTDEHNGNPSNSNENGIEKERKESCKVFSGSTVEANVGKYSIDEYNPCFSLFVNSYHFSSLKSQYKFKQT